MAYIYYIKHKETGKTYIGQTVQPLEQRVRQHLAGSTEVDRALQSLGIQNFEYGIIEQCESEELDEKEIYYIAKYDTYYNGYNNQLGGKKTGKNKYDTIIENIRQDYISGMSMIDLNIKYKVKNESIRYIVKDLERNNIKDNNTNIKKCIICYTKDWQRIEIFESIKEALRFVNKEREKEGKSLVDERNFYRTIKTACTKNGISSGYRWQYAEDVFYDGKEFNSSIDKEKYIMGFDYTEKDGIIYYKKDNSQIEIREKISVELVKELSLEYTNKEAADIVDCTVGTLNKIARENNFKFKKSTDILESEKMSADIFDKINNGYTYTELSEEYQVDYDVIRNRYRRYLKKNGIFKNDNRIINGVRCMELNKEFCKIADAARFLIKSNKGAFELKGIIYKISQAARSGKIYKGYHWEIIEKQ